MALVNYRERYARYSRYFAQLKQAVDKNQQVQESVELLLTFLTISFFIVFALRPTVNTITELWASVNSQKEIGQKLDTKLSNLTQARANYNKEEKRLFLVEQSLPENPSPDLYLAQIEGLVATYSLTLKSFNVAEILLFGVVPKDIQEQEEKKQKIPGVRGAPITFAVTGSFENISAFLDDLENLRQILTVDNFLVGIAKSFDSNITLTVAGTIPSYPGTRQPANK